jgi:DNA-binding transcriptional MocR family regulator
MFALRLLERADELKQTRRRELAERCEYLTTLLKRKLPEWRWRSPSGGATLWIQLPDGSASEFAQVALRHHVLILPGSAFSANGAWDNHFRLPFVLEKSGLEMAVDYLAVAWKDYIGRAKPFGSEKKP